MTHHTELFALNPIVKVLYEDEDETKKNFFFQIVERTFPRFSPEYKLIAAAYELAKKVHDKDVRTTGERYFEHCRAVAIILILQGVQDANVIAAALLHDASEDHGDTYPSTVIANKTNETVACYTGWTNKERFSHIDDKVSRNRAFLANFLLYAPREPALIKIADRAHNTITLWDVTDEKIAEKINEIESFYLPLARKHQFMVRELEECLFCLRNRIFLITKYIPIDAQGHDDDIPF